MFRRPHHQRIESVLRALDADVLTEHQCWFGGGTAIALRNNEFRESVDIDFLVSDQMAYKGLRQLVRDRGFDGLARTPLAVGREPLIDTYGIRRSVLVDGVAIKFEIVHEGRLALDLAGPRDEICGVRTLTGVDQIATKLLANDDRWADSSVFSRDLIDLAMMESSGSALSAGAQKAVDAYGPSVGESLRGLLSNSGNSLSGLIGVLRRCRLSCRVRRFGRPCGSSTRDAPGLRFCRGSLTKATDCRNHPRLSSWSLDSRRDAPCFHNQSRSITPSALNNIPDRPAASAGRLSVARMTA